MFPLIYIIDDEQDIVDLLTLHLKKSYFEVRGFFDVATFYHTLFQKIPDLIILDLMLPDENGFEVCKYLKKEERFTEIPIIILSARMEENEKILGLELGADDYVTKPFSPKELVARVKAVLRRKRIESKEQRIIIDQNMVIELDRYRVLIADREILLTSTEFRILELLAGKRGRVFKREQILDHLWGNEKAILDRTIDVHIKNLREKLGEKGNFIKNVRGVGYKLEI